MKFLSGILPSLMLATLAAAAPPPPAASAAPAAAAPPPLVDACPSQLPVRQAITQNVPGWTSLDEQSSYPFARVAFYPGPPAETTRIVPSAEYRLTAGLHDAWDLPHRPTGYWVACSYGNTTASVARQLPDNVNFCMADYDGRFSTLIVRRWSCGDKRVLVPVRPVFHPQPARPVVAPHAPPVRRAP